MYARALAPLRIDRTPADPTQRSTVTSIWVLTFLAGGSIGPVLGGLLLELWWWRAVFLLGVPVMVILLITGARAAARVAQHHPGRIDAISAALSLAGILAGILAVAYAMKELAAHGLTVAPVIVGIVGAAVRPLTSRAIPGAHTVIDIRHTTRVCRRANLIPMAEDLDIIAFSSREHLWSWLDRTGTM